MASKKIEHLLDAKEVKANFGVVCLLFINWQIVVNCLVCDGAVLVKVRRSPGLS